MGDEHYIAVRKVAEKRLKKRMEFYQHLIAYVMVNAMMLIAFRGQWWVIFPLFGWGMGLIAHGVETFFNDPERHERAIAREMAKLGYVPSDEMPEKPKRGRVALSDDGELLYEDEITAHDDDSESQRRQCKF